MSRDKKEPARKKKPAPARSELAGGSATSGGDAALSRSVGITLRRLRGARSLSLDGLAQLSGVSRSMLSQIELGQSAPTINVLWKISSALGVPFSALLAESPRGGTHVLTAAKTKVLASADGSFSSRALFPYDIARRVEFYELRLQPHSAEVADAHAPGTRENLVVAQGQLELEVGDERHALARGDSVFFEADAPHVYRNPGATETVMYLVMTYADEVRG